jgi:hypothetical protein
MKPPFRPYECEDWLRVLLALAGMDARRGLDVALNEATMDVADSSAVPLVREVQRVNIPCRSN